MGQTEQELFEINRILERASNVERVNKELSSALSREEVLRKENARLRRELEDASYLICIQCGGRNRRKK